MTMIGDKRTFAFETSPCAQSSSDQFLTVDIYVAGKRVTILDNTVWVPHFLGHIEETHRHLRNNLKWLQYRDDLAGMNLTETHLYLWRTEGWNKFLDWGPTTDDVSCHLIIFQDSLWITFFLYSENPHHETDTPLVHGARISPFALVSTLQQQAELMRKYVG